MAHINYAPDFLGIAEKLKAELDVHAKKL